MLKLSVVLSKSVGALSPGFDGMHPVPGCGVPVLTADGLLHHVGDLCPRPHLDVRRQLLHLRQERQ